MQCVDPITSPFCSSILDTAGVGGWRLDLGNETFQITPNLAAVLGADSDKLNNIDDLLELLPVDSRHLYAYNYLNLKNHHRPFNIELKLDAKAAARAYATGKYLQTPDSQFLVGTFQLLWQQDKEDDSTLHKLENLYRTVLEDQLDMVCRFMPDGTITFANRAYCEFFGKSADELIGNVYHPFVVEEDMTRVQEEADVMTPADPIRKTENRVYRYDGEIRWTQWVRRAFFDQFGNKVEEQAVGRDITEQKTAESISQEQQKKLMNAEKVIFLGTLVSGITHEINNPNNFILLNTPLLKEIYLDSLPVLAEHYQRNGEFRLAGLRYSQIKGNIEELYDGIIDGGNRIKRIIKELHDFASPDVSGYNDTIGINEVLKTSTSILSNKIKRSSAKFTIDYGQDIPPFKGSFQKMEQVFLNIVQNACEAVSSKERAIRIRSQFDSERRTVIVTVDDEGVGVPEHHLTKIMLPFFTTKQNAGNPGLGLSICKEIVEKHDGSLNIDSAVSKGTSVCVQIPVGNDNSTN